MSPRPSSPRSPERASRPATPSMVPIFVGVALIVVAALAVAVMNNQQGDGEDTGDGGAATDGAQRNNPFEDIDTSPPDRPGLATRRAPEGLMLDATFTSAAALAAQAKELIREAEAAQEEGDEATWAEKASLAREKLEKAMEDTAEWEMSIQERYGDDDVQVRKIGREIDGWRKLLNKVRKAR